MLPPSASFMVLGTSRLAGLSEQLSLFNGSTQNQRKRGLEWRKCGGAILGCPR